jgi:hypothetical protein
VGQFSSEVGAVNHFGDPHTGCARSAPQNKKSGPGFPAALPLFQPIRLSGYPCKEAMPRVLQKIQRGKLFDGSDGRPKL